MIERGGGRTSGLTDWQLMDVHSMWACLQDQDTTGQWKQVAGWRKICDLALAHLGRLREYRRGLAEAWPPETNAAARAYIGELDQLIDKVQRTHDAAAANYDALAAATRAIGSTRAELKPLHDEYVTKFKQKQAYEEIAADPKAAAGSRLPATSPVTDADLERLNVRARGLMSGLSGELQQAQAMLRQPPPKPNIRRQPDESDSSGVSGAVPVIPPVVPVPTMVKSPAGRRATTSTKLTSPMAGPALGSGPVLGGAGAAVAPTAPNSTSALTPPTTSSQPFGPAVPPLRTGPTAPDSSKISEPRRTQSSPLGKLSTGETSSQPHAPLRSLPTGGLIGGTPTAIGPGDGVPTRRVNPVGGVIGGGGAGTAPSGTAGSRPGSGRASQLAAHNGLSPIGGAPGMGPKAGTVSPSGRTIPSLHEDRESRPWDPDHPWAVDEGVAPVMRPPDDDGPLDPGPAIGLDR